jgi:Zn-dependent peptidase ImmA (M78 family)/transcriptional regulator with XRE-family HTH domain
MNTRRSVDTFDPRRLRLARELNGWTKQRLAAELRAADPERAVTAAALSQFEAGISRPSPQTLLQVALTLGMPRGFFEIGRPISFADSGRAHMRSLRSTTLIERRRALAHASVAWEVFNQLEKYVDFPIPDLPHAVVDESTPLDAFEELAASARQYFGLSADQPIPNMVRLLESRGVAVLRLPLDSRQVDAFCVTIESRPFVLLSGDREDKARSRFEGAHELGHLIAHHDVEPGSNIVEKQAHTFGAAFLMPADAFKAQLPRRVDWAAYIEAKRHWGVSLASIVYRSQKLGLITKDMARRAYTEMNTRQNSDGTSWRKNEPGELGAPEEPQMLTQAIELLSGQGVTGASIANACSLTEEVVRLVVGEVSRRGLAL